MRLNHDEARTRLVASDHAVLATRHPERGADAVPVVFAVESGDPSSECDVVGIPIDRVKDKRPGKLERERNLEAEPRATLLVEQWDPDDWSALWWVRAELRWCHPDAIDADTVERLGAALEERYAQYGGRPFDRLLVFDLIDVSGWAATDTANDAT